MKLHMEDFRNVHQRKQTLKCTEVSLLEPISMKHLELSRVLTSRCSQNIAVTLEFIAVTPIALS